jgi:hypothetical protein
MYIIMGFKLISIKQRCNRVEFAIPVALIVRIAPINTLGLTQLTEKSSALKS